jgi:sugar lactone lactonase YvrE
MRNERVRILTAEMTVATIAGNGEKHDCGDDGPATEACLNFPKAENPEPGGGLALSADESQLYIADTENHRIRVVDLDSGTISAFAGTGEPGYAGDGGAATSAQLNYPRDIAIDPVDGLLYVADTENHVIRAIDLDSGTISTVAGSNVMGNSGDGGPALEATLYRPFGVSVDEDGLVYISDTFNHRIRMVWP